jgi:hypothetical protein
MVVRWWYRQLRQRQLLTKECANRVWHVGDCRLLCKLKRRSPRMRRRTPLGTLEMHPGTVGTPCRRLKWTGNAATRRTCEASPHGLLRGNVACQPPLSTSDRTNLHACVICGRTPFLPPTLQVRMSASPRRLQCWLRPCPVVPQTFQSWATHQACKPAHPPHDHPPYRHAAPCHNAHKHTIRIQTETTTKCTLSHLCHLNNGNLCILRIQTKYRQDVETSVTDSTTRTLALVRYGHAGHVVQIRPCEFLWLQLSSKGQTLV